MLWYFITFIANNRNKSLEIFKLENNCREIMFYQGLKAWICRGCLYACYSHRSLSETMNGGRSGKNDLFSYIGKVLIFHPSVITLLLVSAFKDAGFFFPFHAWWKVTLHRWELLKLLNRDLRIRGNKVQQKIIVQRFGFSENLKVNRSKLTEWPLVADDQWQG